jgi:DNA-binding MarR family transcriptional regulator
VKRKAKIQECKDSLADDSTDHLHIRRQAIVTEFTDNLLFNLDDSTVVSVEIYDWDYDELMETLRADLQKELSLLKYYYSRIKTVGLTIVGAGANGGVETRPDYQRTTDYLYDVADAAENDLVVFINYNGSRPVDGFGWIRKLDIPDQATIVTDGFRACDLDESDEIEVGRLSIEQTVSHLTNELDDIDEDTAAEIHRTHDGNPVAIEIAVDRGELRQVLSGEALRELWSEVYEGKLSKDEYDLLTDSSHLIDLDQRAVTEVTEMTRGQVNETLERLEQKGVVSREPSGLYTTDKYVKKYTAAQLKGKELTEQHRLSFRDHAERWVDAHEARMESVRKRDEQDSEDSVSLPDFEEGVVDPNLFLAAYHLSNVHDDVDEETYIAELEDIDAETSGLFTFGLVAQRFFFEDPTEVIQGLSETILGIDEELESELFSGTLSVFIDFDLQQFLAELATGWSGTINTDEFVTNTSQPEELVRKLQQGIGGDLFENLPPKVKLAIARFISLVLIDSRKASEFFDQFGRTAEQYGLEEEAFCRWAEEAEVLVDELSPETEAPNAEAPDHYMEGFESLHGEIRDRTDLRRYLKENHSEAQREFQQRVKQIRDKPDEIADQFIRCGEQLAETENSIFPYLWYAVGHKLFAPVVLGEEHWDIFGNYKEWSGIREEQEKSIPEDKIVVTKEEIESRLD